MSELAVRLAGLSENLTVILNAACERHDRMAKKLGPGVLNHYDFVTDAIDEKLSRTQDAIKPEPVTFTVRKIKFKPNLEGKNYLKSNAPKVSKAALKIFKSVWENKEYNTYQLQKLLECRYSKVNDIMANLHHWDLLDFEMPKSARFKWKLMLTERSANLGEGDLEKVLLAAFKQPFASASTMKRVLLSALLSDD